jgi:hypothetical protein
MNDLGPSKHRLPSRYQLMSGHQLIMLLRFTRLAVMFAINSHSSDQRFDHARIGVTRQSNYLQSKYSYECWFSQLWLAC